jgi:hypothetical protein
LASAQVNLGALANFGGFTPVMKPGAGSVAIDQGKRTTDENGQLVSVDQRGFARPADRAEANSASGDGTDVGAVELGFPQSGPVFTVNTIAERDGGECTSIDCTLIDALNAANAAADANTINFAPGLVGLISTNTLTPAGLAITNPVTIEGPGPDKMVIASGYSGRLFRVTSANVTISGLDLNSAAVLDENGGTIHNTGGLTLTNCTIVGGTAFNGNGGGVYNAPGGTLTLYGCSFSGCAANADGGGVCNDGHFPGNWKIPPSNCAIRTAAFWKPMTTGSTRLTSKQSSTVAFRRATTGKPRLSRYCRETALATPPWCVA